MRVDALYLFDFGFEVLKILAYPQYVSYPVSQNPEFVSRSGQPFYLFLVSWLQSRLMSLGSGSMDKVR